MDIIDKAKEFAKLSSEEREYIELWTQERNFVENLLCQRFNFLLLTFSVILAGALSAKYLLIATAVLFIGTTICILVSLTIYRIYVKLDHILKLLNDVPNHPVKIIREKVKALGKKGLFGNLWIIGWVIPALCCTILTISLAVCIYKIYC